MTKWLNNLCKFANEINQFLEKIPFDKLLKMFQLIKLFLSL